jgi:hypothetical protein
MAPAFVSISPFYPRPTSYNPHPLEWAFKIVICYIFLINPGRIHLGARQKKERDGHGGWSKSQKNEGEKMEYKGRR